MIEKQKEYIKKYQQKNKEHLKKYDKEYYQKNKEHRKITAKRWKETHLEQNKINNQKWRQKNKENIKKQGKEYRQKNREYLKEHGKEYRYKYKYNLTLEEIDQILIKQNHKCVLCGKSLIETKRCTDHGHETGRVRGILCSRCNISLGHFEYFYNNPELLKIVTEYIKEGV